MQPINMTRRNYDSKYIQNGARENNENENVK